MRAAVAAPGAQPAPPLLPARLDPATRMRCVLILAGEWKRALASLPGWEDDILQVIAPGNAGRDMGPR